MTDTKGYIGMFPDPFTNDEWQSSIHPLLRLMAENASRRGWKVVGLSADEVLDPMRLRQAIDVLHLHWPELLFPSPAAPDFLNTLYKSTKNNRLGNIIVWSLIRFIEKYQTARTHTRFANWQRTLNRCGLPVIWQIHDLITHSVVGDYRREGYHRWLHQQFYQLATIVILHERSCIEPVAKYYGTMKDNAIVPLGDYSEIYGPSVAKSEARHRLGLPTQAKVLAYVGTPRRARNPQRTAELFRQLAFPETYLIVAGNGVIHCVSSSTEDNVLVLNGIVPNDRMRDVFCATDFVVNDAREYLTSAVIRTALSYGVPVIAYPFGSNVDMAAGALIPISDDQGGLEAALTAALRMPPEVYSQLVKAAQERNLERPWARVGSELDDVYCKAKMLKRV